ncbi:MAG: hypothetical protein AAF694_16915 [Bacteroidota bacterium]
MALNISSLRKRIAKGSADKVLQELLEQHEKWMPIPTQNDIAQLSAQLKENKKNDLLGLQTTRESGMELRRINRALLDILTEFEKDTVTLIGETNDPDHLHLECKTNKGKEGLEFVQGEIMRLYVKVSKPCYVRITYMLADGRLVLFKDSFQISEEQVGDFVEIGDGFEASPPFGEEKVFFYAQTEPLNPLPIQTTEDGYQLIAEQSEAQRNNTRGFLPKVYKAESELKFRTK